MNANELADWLDNTTDSEDWGELAKYYKWCKENVAPMLRQQQAEIEALKRPNNVVGVPQDKLVDMQATIHQLQAENEALKDEVAMWKMS